MRIITLFSFSIILLLGCGKSDDNKSALFSLNNNFDAGNFYINNAPAVKGTAHSGQYAYKVDSTAEYGIGIAAKFNDMSSTLPKKASFKCWVFATIPAVNASLVCDPNINGQSLNYQLFDLKNVVLKANEWIEVKGSFDLPKNITPDTELKMYFWNPNKTVFLVDDFEISIE
jgi:hypothetical protein